MEKLSVFGNDYDTIDGTGVREYIHIADLAKGYVKAIENLDKGVNIYNLGTVRGTSVLELVNAFMKVNEIDVPYEIVGRRQGDIATCYADASKAERELNWKGSLGLRKWLEMLGSLSRIIDNLIFSIVSRKVSLAEVVAVKK